MRYQAYQVHADTMALLHFLSQTTGRVLSHIPHGWTGRQPFAHSLAAAQEVFAATRITHARPDYGINSVRLDGSGLEVTVHEEAVHVEAFGTLLHFRKEGITGEPRVLLVAPMSGHFSTLLRDTVRTMLADHDVYITDWHNARDVPLSAGRFDMDEYVHYLILYLQIMGPGAHVVAVCQPCVAALAAAAVMAEDQDPAQPRSLTLMAGPIDTRINPTRVNELATSKPFHWFEKNLIGIVPNRYRGGLRRVYPGFVQLAAFMSMNLERHTQSFRDLHHCLVAGDTARADAIRAFYKEYFAVLDLTAEFYLETIRDVFQEHALPKGQLEWRGRLIRPAAIRHTALLTVEGERDDICAIGQTMAAQELCSRIPSYMKLHHMQTGVGHYGVFSGRRWEQQIYPIVRDVIHSSSQ
ncbi:polyhydroxyalkanoate depolymerase [Noviherbaspirillum denitrificans]|uniref:Poly(3-hydroxybutyrate) depolymerase n=1 Tax=Noviherbaspirillum denitrificans TaxID=1968433 RepID=A0A254TEP8_9BURK|nr:polyhydroxyalkanoate depolymerase [Noviherbaspirillum denitrificans]OWW21139.1 poly(3-hydroxybutyrate) depolymerase [Noviherbaspirillum denitrificans]